MVTAPSSSFLEMSVQYLKGVGPVKARALKRLGIETVKDLVLHFPRDYQNRSEITEIHKVLPGRVCSVEGVVQEFEAVPLNRQLSMGRVLIQNKEASLWGVWFRRTSYRYDVFSSLKKKLLKGTRVTLHGPVEKVRSEWQIRVNDFDVVKEESSSNIHTNRLVPIYDLTEGIDSRWVRELIWNFLPKAISEFEDSFSESFIKKHRLSSFPWSLENIHFPASWADREKAYRRLAFEEFFFFELAIAQVRGNRKKSFKAPPCYPTRRFLTPFRHRLGFDFTQDQKKVINEIFSDMSSQNPMNRLLQGDVGSGKTVVGLSSILLAIENGYQAALMAPTEILAEQHFISIQKMLQGVSINVGLFVSGHSPKEKKRKIEELEKGHLNIAVGTHALLQENIRFKNMGLVVIDEQHRFGVRQRSVLQKKGESPHVLIMTATPIPRTLALTLYGDLNVSTIRNLPPGRSTLKTFWYREQEAFNMVHQELRQGRQAYIVYPLIEESEKLNLKAAVKEFDRLQKTIFQDYRCGLLHGRLKSAEKEAIMAQFSKGKIQVLVATPVIEVGIDVSNASVILIMNADRFGLAQLHQLRGRVGRGEYPSFCCLVSGSISVEAKQRIKLMCQTRDGFRLAEEDLKLRGPGEILGEAQHGVPFLRIGNLVEDGLLIEEVRNIAFLILEEDPHFDILENKKFYQEMHRRYAERLGFGKVG